MWNYDFKYLDEGKPELKRNQAVDFWFDIVELVNKTFISM